MLHHLPFMLPSALFDFLYCDAIAAGIKGLPQ